MITTFGKIVIIVGALVMFILALIVTKRIKELTRAITSISVSVSFQKEHLDVIKRAIIHCTNTSRFSCVENSHGKNNRKRKVGGILWN